MKNNLQGISSRVDDAKNQISYLEQKEAEYNQSELQEEKKNKQNKTKQKTRIV